MSKWQELESKYYMRTFNRTPVVLVRGQGARVWDENGKDSYLHYQDSLDRAGPQLAGLRADEPQPAAALPAEKSVGDKIADWWAGVRQQWLAWTM